MPLNSHSYLVAHGWQGTGKALREGAVSRPVVTTQKKSLAGVGKDRDEAFPFWDHVFTAAATSIKVKLYTDDGDEDSDTPQPSSSSAPLDRTSTGIISNKPQKVGLSALTTPATSKVTGLSVMALAKREAARRGLYSKFFRGPVLGPGAEEPQVHEVAQPPSPFKLESSGPKCSTSVAEIGKVQKRKYQEGDEETEVVQKKRRLKRKMRQREKGRLKKEAEKSVVSEFLLDGEVETGLTNVPTAPGNSVQGDDIVDCSREKSRKKKRKRIERESITRHDG